MTFSRRHLFGFLSNAAAGAASALVPEKTATRAETPRETEAIESALEILATTGPEYGGGLSNHGPMAADALVAMGRPEEVVPWVERYRGRLSEPLRGRKGISEQWREALGQWDRAGDWIVYFRRAIADRPWPRVLSDWTARLAPGASAAAFHGLIRTAHAVRSLSRRDTPRRRRELAEGLAYWAARYRAVPDSAPWTRNERLPSHALASVPRLPASDRVERAGSITEALEPLAFSNPFGEVAGLVDSGLDGSRFVSDAADTFTRVYLEQSTPRSAIAFLHAVTGPSAARLLLPHVDERARRSLLRYVWQGAAGIYAVFARPEPVTPPPMAAFEREDIVDRAVAAGDEHAIKLAEACLREHAVFPSPAFLAAAADGALRFRRT